jgi:glycosyltransferase involved in cell wall biosynthesis
VINNVSGLGTAFIRNSWLTRLAKALYRAAFAQSRVVFFQNEDDRTLFTEERLVRPEKTALVPGSGVDLARYQPRPPHMDGQFRFLVVARLLWDKGIQEFVDAARLVRRQEPGARFQLLGFLDVENRTAVSRAAVEGWGAEGLIEYLGTALDVRDHIAAADCVVLPSYREGTPRSLLEAAAMGKPLITTDVPGCRNVVDHGVNGFLCAAQDASDLADHMLKMIRVPDKLRAAMGAASRTKAEQSFDEGIVITKYVAAVDEALESRGLQNGRYASSAVQPSHH